MLRNTQEFLVRKEEKVKWIVKITCEKCLNPLKYPHELKVDHDIKLNCSVIKSCAYLVCIHVLTLCNRYLCKVQINEHWYYSSHNPKFIDNIINISKSIFSVDILGGLELFFPSLSWSGDFLKDSSTVIEEWKYMQIIWPNYVEENSVFQFKLNISSIIRLDDSECHKDNKFEFIDSDLWWL